MQCSVFPLVAACVTWSVTTCACRCVRSVPSCVWGGAEACGGAACELVKRPQYIYIVYIHRSCGPFQCKLFAILSILSQHNVSFTKWLLLKNEAVKRFLFLFLFIFWTERHTHSLQENVVSHFICKKTCLHRHLKARHPM